MLARSNAHDAEPIEPPLYAFVHCVGSGAGVRVVNCFVAFVMPAALLSHSGVHQPLLAPEPCAIATQFDAVAGHPLAPEPAAKSHF